MPDWSQILDEINAREAAARAVSPLDDVRRHYLKELHKQTKRNIVVYYSGWLQNPLGGTEINDEDKTGFMTVLHELDHEKGLDLILHTPGGQTGATESLVDYLRAVFGTNIRAFVPHLAMSGGTVIACGCKEIYMGKHSSLGPIDPQIDGKPVHGILSDFNRAFEEVKSDPDKILVWQPILTKYQPALIDQCEKAIEMVREMVIQWLQTGMFENDDEVVMTLDDGTDVHKSTFIADTLINADIFKSHARHTPRMHAYSIKSTRYQTHRKSYWKEFFTSASIIITPHNSVETPDSTRPIAIFRNRASHPSGYRWSASSA